MKYLFVFLVTAALMNANTSCNKDTCNDQATFTSVEAKVIETSSTEVKIELSWQQGKALPVSYFEAVHLITGTKDPYGETWQNDHSLVSEIKAQSETTLHIVFAGDLTGKFGQNIILHLQFPDRMKYVDCVHPGSADSYYLDITLQVDEVNGSTEVSTFSWDELLIKGGS